MTDNIAIITGHHRGIGKAIADHFKKAGYLTIGIDQIPSSVAEHNIGYDLSAAVDDADQVTVLRNQIDQLIPAKSKITLVNNAAIQIVKSFNDLDATDLSTCFNINTLVPFIMVKLLDQIPNSELKTVINISSIHQQLSKSNFLAYSVSKSALSGLTRSLSLEIGHKTRVCEIQPAAVETTMLKDGLNNDNQALDQLKSQHPSNCIGKPEDVGALVVTIAEQSSMFLNGCVINLDGGISNRLYDPS